MPLACDYSFARPDPAAVKAAGYVAVLRYLSGGNNPKDLTGAEASALHAEGLNIGVVWETTGTDFSGGAAQGAADARAANAEANTIGVPATVPIFFAIDTNADPASVLAYFRGARDASGRQVRGYGSDAVIDALAQDGFAKGWQTEAWSGSTVSPNAALYQRVTPTLAVAGAAGEYDEDVILDPSLPWWTPAPAPAPAPAPISPVSGGHVNQHTVSFTTDANGNGWVDSPVDVSKIVSVVATELDPAQINGYMPTPRFAGITADQKLVFMGGEPGSYTYYVWSVA